MFSLFLTENDLLDILDIFCCSHSFNLEYMADIFCCLESISVSEEYNLPFNMELFISCGTLKCVSRMKNFSPNDI